MPNIRALPGFVTSRQQQNQRGAATCDVDAVTGTIVDAQFADTATERFDVTELAE